MELKERYQDAVRLSKVRGKEEQVIQIYKEILAGLRYTKDRPLSDYSTEELWYIAKCITGIYFKMYGQNGDLEIAALSVPFYERYLQLVPDDEEMILDFDFLLSASYQYARSYLLLTALPETISPSLKEYAESALALWIHEGFSDMERSELEALADEELINIAPVKKYLQTESFFDWWRCG